MTKPARRPLPDRRDIATLENPESPAITQLNTTRILTTGGTQMRAAIDDNTVLEYRQAMVDPDGHPDWGSFPPVTVVYDGTNHWLADGFHRLVAWRAVHNTADIPIPARVLPGDRRTAILHAAGANASHGLRRTNADKRRAVETLLRDDEWRSWSDQEIARRCAVDPKTVGNLRRQLAATLEIPESATRRTADGRTLNTAPIGATRAPTLPPLSAAQASTARTAASVLASLPGLPPAAVAPAASPNKQAAQPDETLAQASETWTGGAVSLDRDWSPAELAAYDKAHNWPPGEIVTDAPPAAQTADALPPDRQLPPLPATWERSVKLHKLRATFQVALNSLDDYSSLTGYYTHASSARRELAAMLEIIERNLAAIDQTPIQETTQL